MDISKEGTQQCIPRFLSGNKSHSQCYSLLFAVPTIPTALIHPTTAAPCPRVKIGYLCPSKQVKKISRINLRSRSCA